MNIQSMMLFSSPVMSTQVDNSEKLNVLLREHSYKLKSASLGVESGASNLGGWHSETDFFRRKEPCFIQLQKQIMQFAKAAAVKVNGKLDFTSCVQEFNGWININPPGTMNKPHDHPEFDMSGTYYVQTPKTSNPGQGVIEFIDPKVNSAMSKIYCAPGFDRSFRVSPREGQLICFPSYLRHWVYPNEANDDRISIAWNYRLK